MSNVMRLCGRIYKKIATDEEMKVQMDMWEKQFQGIKEKSSSLNFSNLNKCLYYICNIMTVGELDKHFLKPERLNLILSFYKFLHTITNNDIAILTTHRYTLYIIGRVFKLEKKFLVPEKNEKYDEEFLSLILESINKLYELFFSVLNQEQNRKFFNGFLSAYFQVFFLLLDSKVRKVTKLAIHQSLSFLLREFISVGKKIFFGEEEVNLEACRLLKLATKIEIEGILPSLTSAVMQCYDYGEYLFTSSNNDESVSNSLEILYDLIKNHPEFKGKNFDSVILKLSHFMKEKKDHRYPALLSLKLLELYLTPEYLENYIKQNNPSNSPTHSIDFLSCIVAVMTAKMDMRQGKLIKYSGTFIRLRPVPGKSVDLSSELEISATGIRLLALLVDENKFKNMLREFKENCEKYNRKYIWENKDKGRVKFIINGDNNEINNRKLEDNIYRNIVVFYSLMTIKQFYLMGSTDILSSIIILIEKEVKYIEDYKSDIDNEKSPDYTPTITASNLRIQKIMALISKINLVSLAEFKMDNYSTSFNIIYYFLSSSSDALNIQDSLNFLTENIKQISSQESHINLENGENVLEKNTNITIILFRKMIEDEKTLAFILENLIALADNRNKLCNLMVKGGIIRLLFQVIDQSREDKNIELALTLLLLISQSNEDNLKMVANQNAFNKFLEIKVKKTNKSNIINLCNLIINEIMKLPGQEKFADEYLNTAILEFNQNSKLNPILPDTNKKLLANLESINSFATNKKHFDKLSKGEFLNNFQTLCDRNFKENISNQTVEKLISNELLLMQKLCQIENFDGNYAVEKLINAIKHKAKSRNIMIKSSESLLKILKNSESYERLLKSKIDNTFVDAIFAASEMYAEDAEVSKNINNVICYMCLRDPQLAKYIKEKGGFEKFLEELKSIINMDDPQSQQMKLNSLKMLEFLSADKDGMEKFIKAGGKDILNNLIENEIENNKDSIDIEKGSDLFKTKSTILISKHPTSSRRKSTLFDEGTIFQHCVNIIKNAVKFGYNEIFDDKTIDNLTILSLLIFPSSDLFEIICDLFVSKIAKIPKDDIDKFILLKNCLCYEIIYPEKTDFIEKISKIKNNNLYEVVKYNLKFINGITNSLNENTLDIYCLTYLDVFINTNDNYSKLLDERQYEIYTFTYDIFKNYLDPTKDLKINTGVLISIMRLMIYCFKNSKIQEKINKEEIITGLLNLGESKYNEYPNECKFSVIFIENFEEILKVLGLNIKGNKLYLRKIVGKTNEFFEKILKICEEKKSFKELENNEHEYKLYMKNIEYFCEFYGMKDNGGNCDYEKVFSIIENLIEKTNTLDCSPKTRNEVLSKLYNCILNILDNYTISENNTKSLKFAFISEPENKLYLFGLIENSIKSGYDNKENLCEKIINILSLDFDNANLEFFMKIINFIYEEIKTNKNNNENISQNKIKLGLSALSRLSQNPAFVKQMISNKEMLNVLCELYKNEGLGDNRENLASIYSCMMKNSFNIDSILSDSPETLQVLLSKTALPENIVKDKKYLSIAVNELGALSFSVRDENILNLLLSKGIFDENNLRNTVKNYKGFDSSIKGYLEIIQKSIEDIIEKGKKNEKGEKGLENDKKALEYIKKIIKDAYDEHLEIVQNANPGFKVLPTDILYLDEEDKDFPLEVQRSTIKQRKLSEISQELFYNPKNATIASPISLEEKDEVASALESLLALIRLIYNNCRNDNDKEIVNKRLDVLLDSLMTLKLLSISPENHMSIAQNGLLSFLEKLTSDKFSKGLNIENNISNKTEEENKENNSIDDKYLRILTTSLANLKNCTWSESCVLLMIDSQLFYTLTDEMMYLYENPQKIEEKKEYAEMFLHYNIMFSNVSKCQKGFDALFKKLSLAQLISLGASSGNVDLITAINEMLIKHLSQKDLDVTGADLSKISKICARALALEDQSQNLVSKSLKLMGMMYEKDKDNKDGNKKEDINLVGILNNKWDIFKEDSDFILNSVYALIGCLKQNQDKNSEVIDCGLLDKISKEINVVKPNDEINMYYCMLIRSIIENNEENQKKICNEEFIKLLVTLLEIYRAYLNKTEDLITLNYQIAALTRSEQILANQKAFRKKKIEQILKNIFIIFSFLSLYPEAKTYMVKYSFVKVIFSYMGKKIISAENEEITVKILKNFFNQNAKDNLTHSEVEELYLILKSLQKTYYSNNEIIEYVNDISGYILKDFDSKYYTPRFYNIVLDGINCQDFNQKFVKKSLEIIKDALISHSDIINEVFETSKGVMLNILRIYNNVYDIQKLTYEILCLLSDNRNNAFSLINSDILDQVKYTLTSEDSNENKEEKLSLHLISLDLLFLISRDSGSAQKVGNYLMKTLISLMGTYPKITFKVLNLIVLLSKNQANNDYFIDNGGMDIIGKILGQNNGEKGIDVKCLKIIKQIFFSSPTNQQKIIDSKIDQKIRECLDNSQPGSLEKFEAKILLKDLSYKKEDNSKKEIKADEKESIEKIRLIKNNIIPYFSGGINVKGVNKKAKVKEFVFMISCDLMKIMFKKPKMNNIPAKTKYTLDTPLVTDIRPGYGSDIFKKIGGIFSKPPEENLCLTIEQKNEKNQSKVLNIICQKVEQREQIIYCTEIIVNYIKTSLNLSAIETYKANMALVNCVLKTQTAPKKDITRGRRTIHISKENYQASDLPLLKSQIEK